MDFFQKNAPEFAHNPYPLGWTLNQSTFHELVLRMAYSKKGFSGILAESIAEPGQNHCWILGQASNCMKKLPKS